jgi:hypothetical protein
LEKLLNGEGIDDFDSPARSAKS